MNIPASFKLGGLTWKVVWRKRLKGKYGECVLEKQIIHILEGLPPELTEQTFLHELCHAIHYAMGKNEHDEEFIDAFATMLHQALTSMQYE